MPVRTTRKFAKTRYPIVQGKFLGSPHACTTPTPLCAINGRHSRKTNQLRKSPRFSPAVNLPENDEGKNDEDLYGHGITILNTSDTPNAQTFLAEIRSWKLNLPLPWSVTADSKK